MNTLRRDVVIIGTGTAGMTAYRSALAHTSSVLAIESGLYGTTCARVGCMPSKLLIAAAEAAHGARAASGFGVHIEGLRIDGEAVMKRVREERDRFVGFVVDAVDQWPAEHKLRGHARFVAPGVLQVDAHTRIEAGRVIIATGSRPDPHTGWRTSLGDRLIINDDVFAWTTLPRAVAVVGTGVIGLELAQALHRLGVRVRLYGRSRRVGPLTDPTLQALATQVIGQELPLTLEAELDVRRDGDEVVVHARSPHGSSEERFDYLLSATGRTPNVDDLGLEHADLPLGPDGIPLVDRHTGRIGTSTVFMAGDAGEEHKLLHEAADSGRIAGDNAGRYPDVRMRPRRAGLSVTFSDPQMMLAGIRYADLLKHGTAFQVGRVSFEDQGRSRVMLKNHGALHVYAEIGTGRFLGAEMIGPAAEHLGHLLSWSAQRGDTVQQMLDSVFYHPVVEEGLRTALRELQRALRMGPVPVERCLDCGPGA